MKKLITLISLSVLALFVSGCGENPQPKAPKKPVIDHTLPKMGQIKHISDITQIGFEWKIISDPRIEGYYIYRSNPESNKTTLSRVATITDRYSSHFVDNDLKPESQYYYRFSTYTNKKTESVASNAIRVSTLPKVTPVSFVKAISGLPHRVKLIWRPHTSLRVKSYIVERNEFNTVDWRRLATVEGRLNAEYIDSGLSDNRYFRYRVRVKTYAGLVSKPSQIVEAGTKPLPIVIKNLKASTKNPNKILLDWNRALEKDFLYYKIYRAINPMLFYSYLAKTKDTKYEDVINEDGKSYYYFVTSVDKDGLESLRQNSAMAGSTLSLPSSVYITSSAHDGKKVNITWKSKDRRAVTHRVIKEYKKIRKIFTGVNGSTFIDEDVIKGVEYKYYIIAVDKYGLSSKKSEAIIIKMPKE